MTSLRKDKIMTQLEEDLMSILREDTAPTIQRAQMLHLFFIVMLKHGIYQPTKEFIKEIKEDHGILESLCEIAAYVIRYDSSHDLSKIGRITDTIERSKWVRLSDAKFFLDHCHDEEVDESLGNCFLHEYIKDTTVMQELILYFFYAMLHDCPEIFSGNHQMMALYGDEWYQCKR